MNRAVLAALGVVFAGCAGVTASRAGGATATTVARHTVATARYDPRDRDAVWGRALSEFQARGVLVAASDREGGVLTSQQQPAEVPCDGGSCRAVVALQLTLAPDGLATLRTQRVVTTGSDRVDVAADVQAKDQQETNELLTAIAGSPAVTVEPPAAPKPVAPAPTRTIRPSMPCESYRDCPPGSLCTEGGCRP